MVRLWTAACLLVAILAAGLMGQEADDAAVDDIPTLRQSDADELGPIEGPRQLFSALGMGDEPFSKFQDGVAISDYELEPLLQSLHDLAQFPSAKVFRWTKRNVRGAQVFASPEESRGELFHFAGRAKRVTRVEPPAELAERFETAQVDRCEVELQDGSRAEVFTMTVPKAWQFGEAMDEPVSFNGVFLKTTSPPGTQPPAFAMVAQRIAWHPPTALGKLGLDVGLLDGIVHNRAISGEEAEGFYQLLAAIGHTNLNELLAATRGQQWTVIPAASDKPGIDQVVKKLKAEHPELEFYFADEPEKYVGDLMAFEGQVYRCVEVRLTDKDLIERLGLDHYYNLTVFIDLEYQLRLPGEAADEEQARAEGRRPMPTRVTTYPISACVRQLPPGFPEGEKLKETVRVPGYFFKRWAFRSKSAAKLHPNHPDHSPLIVGPGVEWLSKPQPADATTPMIVGGLIASLLAILCLVLWRTSRRDRAFRREFLSKDRTAGALESIGETDAKPMVD